MPEANLKIDLSTGSIEVTGSEDFIQQLLPSLKELLAGHSAPPQAVPATRVTTETSQAVSETASAGEPTDVAP